MNLSSVIFPNKTCVPAPVISEQYEHFNIQFSLAASVGGTTHQSKTLIARFMGPTWGPPWSDRTQMGPILVPRTLLSGIGWIDNVRLNYHPLIAVKIMRQRLVCHGFTYTIFMFINYDCYKHSTKHSRIYIWPYDVSWAVSILSDESCLSGSQLTSNYWDSYSSYFNFIWWLF